MSKPSQLESARTILICLLVFFAGTIFLNIISGAIIAILLYFLLRYRSRVKELERSGGSGRVVSGEVPTSSEP